MVKDLVNETAIVVTESIFWSDTTPRDSNPSSKQTFLSMYQSISTMTKIFLSFFILKKTLFV